MLLEPVQPAMPSIALQPVQPGSPRCLQLPAAARTACDAFNCLLQPVQPAMPSITIAATGYVRRPLETHCSTPADLFLALVTGALSGRRGLGSGDV